MRLLWLKFVVGELIKYLSYSPLAIEFVINEHHSQLQYIQCMVKEFHLQDNKMILFDLSFRRSLYLIKFLFKELYCPVIKQYVKTSIFDELNGILNSNLKML